MRFGTRTHDQLFQSSDKYFLFNLSRIFWLLIPFPPDLKCFLHHSLSGLTGPITGQRQLKYHQYRIESQRLRGFGHSSSKAGWGFPLFQAHSRSKYPGLMISRGVATRGGLAAPAACPRTRTCSRLAGTILL